MAQPKILLSVFSNIFGDLKLSKTNTVFRNPHSFFNRRFSDQSSATLALFDLTCSEDHTVGPWRITSAKHLSQYASFF
jgi:hypothetical protein